MPSPQKSQTCSEHKNVEAADDTYEKARRLQRAQWLRAAILGACDGLLSTTSLMLGIGAAEEDRRSMILSGLAGAVAGSFSMAVGEFVSVATQRDIEKANVSCASSKSEGKDAPATKIKIIAHEASTEPETRPGDLENNQSSKSNKLSPSMEVLGEDTSETYEDKEGEMVFTNPYKAAAASGLAFLCGASLAMLPAIFLIRKVTRIVVIVVVTSMASALFGSFGAYLGGSSIRLAGVRTMVGGWIAMSVTYCLLKPFDSDDTGISK